MYAGGRGGGIYNNSGIGLGGSGGGGDGGGGSSPGTNAQNGTTNSGSGGGGAGFGSTGSGGSGIVIIRYADTFAAAASTTGSPSISVSGGYRIYSWTSSGSITI
jgi:hypothetical protein